MRRGQFTDRLVSDLRHTNFQRNVSGGFWIKIIANPSIWRICPNSEKMLVPAPPLLERFYGRPRQNGVPLLAPVDASGYSRRLSPTSPPPCPVQNPSGPVATGSPWNTRGGLGRVRAAPDRPPRPSPTTAATQRSHRRARVRRDGHRAGVTRGTPGPLTRDAWARRRGCDWTGRVLSPTHRTSRRSRGGARPDLRDGAWASLSLFPPTGKWAGNTVFVPAPRPPLSRSIENGFTSALDWDGTRRVPTALKDSAPTLRARGKTFPVAEGEGDAEVKMRGPGNHAFRRRWLPVSTARRRPRPRLAREDSTTQSWTSKFGVSRPLFRAFSPPWRGGAGSISL